MELDSFLAMIKSDVSDVSGVHRFENKVLPCNVSATAAVADVSRQTGTAGFATSATAGVFVTFHEKPKKINGVTCETSETSEKINVWNRAKVSPTNTAMMDRWRCTRPDGRAETWIIDQAITIDAARNRWPGGEVEPASWPGDGDEASGPPLTDDDRARLRRWLLAIGEQNTDEVMADAMRRPEYGRALLRAASEGTG